MNLTEVNPLVVIGGAAVIGALGVLTIRLAVAWWDALREARYTIKAIEESGRTAGQTYRSTMNGYPIETTAHNEVEWTEHDDEQ